MQQGTTQHIIYAKQTSRGNVELDQKIHGKNQAKNAAGIINPRVMKKQKKQLKTKQKKTKTKIFICEKNL